MIPISVIPEMQRCKMIKAQMTPIPAQFKPNETSPELEAFMGGEADAFLEWIGSSDKKDIVADILPGYEHSFLLLRSKSENKKALAQFSAFRCNLSGDVVMGDIGTTDSDGQCFANRCRWTFGRPVSHFWGMIIIGVIFLSLLALLIFNI